MSETDITAAQPPLLPPGDPHADLERLPLAEILEERHRLYAKAANDLKNLEDLELGRLSRCLALLRRMGNSGPPASPKRLTPAKRAAALPADLSDIPE